MTKKEPFVSGKRKMLLAELSALERKEGEEAKLAELRKRGTVGKVFGFDCEETSGCPGTGQPLPVSEACKVAQRIDDECMYGADDTCGVNIDKATNLIAQALAKHAESECSRLASRVEELEKGLELAAIRLGKCAARMRGCNEARVPEYHELLDEVVDWRIEADRVLAGAHAEERPNE